MSFTPDLTNPRQLVLEALVRWESGREFADDILHTAFASAKLSPADRGLAMELFYGILRNRTRLDFVVDMFRTGHLDRETQQALRLGIYQLYHTRIPEHAAVHETVGLAGRARGLVNAILRNAQRERRAVEAKLEAESADISESHPRFLLERWQKQFGEDGMIRLCDYNNQAASVTIRANTLKITRDALLARPDAAKIEAAAHPFHPDMMTVGRLPMEWLAEGLCYAQDPSTLVAGMLLAPQPGETILDACAAPGGKTAHLAALMNNEGRIAACDADEKRVARLSENMLRLGVACSQPFQLDWLQAKNGIPFAPGTFDRVLLDAPCTNTGVLRRRVDARWRLTPMDFEKMSRIQLDLLKAIVPLLKPGGTLVYSTCSLETEENQQLAQKAAATISGLTLAETKQTIPYVDAVDGSFAAKFVLE